MLLFFLFLTGEQEEQESYCNILCSNTLCTTVLLSFLILTGEPEGSVAQEIICHFVCLKSVRRTLNMRSPIRRQACGVIYGIYVRAFVERRLYSGIWNQAAV